jgi:predicted phage replisome organizer
MSELKWIALKCGMFDHAKIRCIEAMPDGETLLVCWVKILTQAGKTNAGGFIFLAEKVPFTVEQLAVVFSRPLNTVRLALETFRRLNMIEIEDGGLIKVTGWEEHQNYAGLEKYREHERHRKNESRQRAALAGAEPKALPAPQARDVSEHTVKKWEAAWSALTGTGKIPSLKVEHLVLVDRDHPRAALAQNYAEIVSEVEGVTGTVSTALPWLRKAVSRLESRRVACEGSSKGGDKW